jgi:cellulose synthase operon protein C
MRRLHRAPSAFAIAFALVLVADGISAQPAQPSPSGPSGPSVQPSGPLASGLAALAASDYPKAESELAQVKGAAQSEAEIALGRVALEQGKLADAEKHAIVGGGSPSLKTKAGVLRAEIMLAQGKQKEAIALLETLKGGKGVDARRARLFLGQTLIAIGKRAGADDPLKKVIEDYNDNSIGPKEAEGLSQVGRAAFLLRSPKDANTAFKESERADKKRVETLLWEAELFLDKYDPGHAAEVVKEALGAAPKNADALVMMARVKLDQTLDFDDAEKLVKEALAIHPRHVGALAVRAGLALRDMDIQNADKAIAEGLAANPNDLELLSLKAAARFLDDDLKAFETQKKEVFARNAEFARFYGIVGEYAEWEHRYDDIVAMMKEAVKIDPDDGKAWADLGLTQMRAGDEDKGLEAVKKAWSKDKFNVRVFNTLNMYEQQIPTDYELITDGIFKVRYAKEERAVMERYVPRMLGEAWASMKARYNFVPKVPVQVELYANREQFSVRTSGLPNIGIQGVCFGGMIAAISPKAEPFNWGNVVWHELGHVFAIQLSKNHVPRWFTEGLSEYETIARRPEWARELDPELYQAITQNKLPGAVDMNRAFTHANDAADVTTAYYAASQMLIWTVERFGMKGVVKALELWGQGKRTPEVIKTAFGVSPEEYDKGYREWQLARLSRYKDQYIFTLKPRELDEAKKAAAEKPNDPGAHVAFAMSLIASRKIPDAKKELEAALSLDPKHGDAHFVSAKLALGEKDAARAEKHLDTMRTIGKDGYVVHMLLTDIAESKEDKTKMRFHLEAAHRLDPSQTDPLRGLYDLAHEAKKEGDELELLRQLAQLEQHDKKVWRLLLDKLVAQKAWDEARKVGESAVFVDVTGGPTHVLYARALAAQNAHEKAVFELETALLTNMKDKEKAAVHGLLAQSLAALKRNADAVKNRDAALKLDPENAEAKALKL